LKLYGSRSRLLIAPGLDGGARIEIIVPADASTEQERASA